MKASSISFGRAFTTAEMQKWEKIKDEAKKALNLNETTMICFDSCMPSKKTNNTGIGTSASQDAIEFMDFMSKMAGVNAIQLQPQGRLPKDTNSPFSGTVFSIGEHIIDLKQLTSKKYGEILPVETYSEATGVYEQDATYERILDENNAHMRALRTAFKNFQKLSKSSSLKKEYDNFIKSNSDWLESEVLFDCLAEENQEGNWKKWPHTDRYLLTDKVDKKTAQARIDEIKDKHKDKYDFTLFTQFIADKQLSDAKATYNKMGIKVAGDCLIGFSEKEHWANQDAFYSNCTLGCEDRHYDDRLQRNIIKQINWGMPALDYDKIGTSENLGPAGKLFARKFEKYFKRYDSLRIDAAWQLVRPHVIHVDFETGEKERVSTHEQGDKLLKIMDDVLKKTRPDDYKTYRSNLELLGCNIYFDPMFQNRAQIQHSIYQHSKWGSVNFYKEKGLNEDNMTFGIGTHDDDCLIDIFYQKSAEQAPVLSRNLGVSEYKTSTDITAFSNAKFGEAFTVKNNFFTVFDALGAQKRINNPNNGVNNWRARVSSNYEEEYFSNLKRGLGLNLPAAYLVAMNAKGIANPELKAKLEKASEILKADGANTIKESDSKLGKNYSEL